MTNPNQQPLSPESAAGWRGAHAGAAKLLPTAVSSPGPHTPPEDIEETYYEGSPPPARARWERACSGSSPA